MKIAALVPMRHHSQRVPDNTERLVTNYQKLKLETKNLLAHFFSSLYYLEEYSLY